jgi:hypothetical protein
MKSILCGLLLFLTIISSKLTKYYTEDPANMLRRLNYLQSYSNDVTDGYIEYVFTPETGIYCKAKRDINSYETTFRIPANNIISVCKNIKNKENKNI